MEFNEKLQELRAHRGLTQEQLAQSLYVSRTAISKWESGRGFPSIESLKAISRFFSVSVDELLSGEEVLTIAQEDNRQKAAHFRKLVFGLLDCSFAMFFLLPIFGQRAGGSIQAVALPALTEVQPYLKLCYIGIVICMAAWGLLTLILQHRDSLFGAKGKHALSLLLNTAAVLLFTVSQQPYAAVYALVFLLIKGWILIKRP